MQYVYICGAVSGEMNEALGRSVAGNKFSLNMARALDGACHGNLTFISTAAVPQTVVEQYGGEIWPGKRLHLAPRGKHFVLGDLIQRRNILRRLAQVRREHPGEKITVFLENSPFAAATACATAKKKFDISCYSITIDTPFTGNFRGTGVRGRINTWMFLRGRLALRCFDGLISFTPDVERELHVDIPFCPLAIGCTKESISKQMCAVTEEKTAVYAGTLIHYNGIRELLQAFALLGTDYQLHIYGYGPMENEVRKAAQEYSNIVFHGRFDPADTESILSQYQLLINPRRIDPAIENFTFPSKLVDYVLTGKSVLSSKFKTLPEAYGQFVYLLDDLSPESIAAGVRRVFEDDVQTRRARGEAGVQYIKEHQTYDKIAGNILKFAEG